MKTPVKHLSAYRRILHKTESVSGCISTCSFVLSSVSYWYHSQVLYFISLCCCLRWTAFMIPTAQQQCLMLIWDFDNIHALQCNNDFYFCYIPRSRCAFSSIWCWILNIYPQYRIYSLNFVCTHSYCRCLIFASSRCVVHLSLDKCLWTARSDIINNLFFYQRIFGSEKL